MAGSRQIVNQYEAKYQWNVKLFPLVSSNICEVAFSKKNYFGNNGRLCSNK